MYYSIGQLFDSSAFNLTNLVNPATLAVGLKFYQQDQLSRNEEDRSKREAASQQRISEMEQLTETERLKTEIEIERLRAKAQADAQQSSGQFGLSQTKLIVIGGLATISILGFVMYKARGKK